jgi:hypothetical protein
LDRLITKADSKVTLHELFAARDYGELVFSLARVYRYSENAIVLEVFDLEEGSLMYHLELDVPQIGFAKDERIERSFVSLDVPDENRLEFELIVVMAGRIIALRSNHTVGGESGEPEETRRVVGVSDENLVVHDEL